ncbi:hypothetical protein E2C01_008403 [Portunus trituberculatus]|uniref:Uncharacterized protein n=1 Tax=Portunus trituberculatus TaxID=210409 RepID=A0A5B7D3X6_PORTR|nr:hypothetical protein [Portunus trituberculatus]
MRGRDAKRCGISRTHHNTTQPHQCPPRTHHHHPAVPVGGLRGCGGSTAPVLARHTYPLFVTGLSTARRSLARGKGCDGQGEGRSLDGPGQLLGARCDCL